MQLEEVMAELEGLGTEQCRKIFRNHGATESFFGVKVGDLKTLAKKLKKRQDLAEQLFATGNLDAQYLAGLIADPKQMPPEKLDAWAAGSGWYMVGEYMVAGVAAEGPHGWERGLAWIESDTPSVACVGWTTLAGVLSITPDDKLDLARVEALLERVGREITGAPNRVRYTMNGFVIAVGCYVEALSARAQELAKTIGKVEVSMGTTSCKVPFAPDYIRKVVDKGRLGKKRKKVRC